MSWGTGEALFKYICELNSEVKDFLRLKLKEDCMEEPKNIMPEHRRKISEYVGAIIANGFILFVLNNLYNWRVPFLTESYQKCIWAIDVSLGAMIIVNFVFIFFDRDRFKHLLQIFTSAASFLALYIINWIFPFVFTEPAWFIVVKVLLIVSMVATGASVLYNLIRTIIPYRLKS